MNADIINQITASTEEVSFLSGVRKDDAMSFYLPYRDEKGIIVNYQKIGIDGKERFIRNRFRLPGTFVLGTIERKQPVYVCSDWREALSIFTMQKETVVLPSSRSSMRKVEATLKARGCIIKEPTVEDQIRPRETSQVPAEWPSPAMPASTDLLNRTASIGQDTFYIGNSLLGHFTPVRWLIRGFFPRGRFLGFIYSPSGVGKTFFALDAALHMASGLPSWHGFICHRAKVLYVAGESEAAIRSRIIAFAKTYTDAFLENFCFYPLSAPLSSAEGMERLQNTLRELESAPYGFKPDIIFLDTWNTFFTGEENNAVDVARFRADVILRLQIFNDCAIVFLHHTTKANDEDMRGSGAIKGMADFTLRVSYNKEGGIRQTVTKNRLGPEGDYVDARIKTVAIESLGKDEDGFHVSGACLEHSGNSKSLGMLSAEATSKLSAIRDAMTLHGTPICTGVWSLSGSAIEEHMRDVYGKDEAWLSENLSRTGSFFDELVDSGHICISRDEDGRLASITMLSPNENDSISRNRGLTTGQQAT